MTEIPAYTLEELNQRARDHIRSRLRGADVSYGSDYDLTARLLGTIAFMFQKQVDTPLRLLDPRKAFGTFLREFAGNMGLGAALTETSVAAQRARGKVIILSTTGSQMQAAGSQLRHADGTLYTLDSNTTTPASATLTLRAGHRSGRRRVFQGHVGGGFQTVLEGQVYQFSPTSEYCAVYGYDNAGNSGQYLFDLYNDLDQTPAMHDQFVQKLGAVGSITASVGGQAGNKDPKDVLTFVSPSGTIQGTAYILALSGGREALTPAQMQEAIRKLHGSRLGAMTLEEIRQIALATPGLQLREVFNTPGRFGPGSHLLFPVGATYPFVTIAAVAEISSYVSALVSPADKIQAYAQLPLEDTITEIDIKVTSDYAPDWTTPTALPIAAASTTTRVNLAAGDVTAAVARGLAVDARVIVSMASPLVDYLVQRRVTAVGATYVDVDSPLPYPPTTAGFVTPGGPIGQDIIDAFYGHYDNQTPSVETTANTYYRYPAPDTTESAQGLTQRVSDVVGVVDVSAVASGPVVVSFVGQVLVPGAVQILMWT